MRVNAVDMSSETVTVGSVHLRLGAVYKATFSKCSLYKFATTGDNYGRPNGFAIGLSGKISPVDEIAGVTPDFHK